MSALGIKPENYAGSCIVCLRGTDTGVAVEGELEWLAAFLVLAGMPKKVAEVTVTQYAPPVDQSGRTEVLYRVCRACMDVANDGRDNKLPDPVLIYADAEIPCVRQPKEDW